MESTAAQRAMAGWLGSLGRSGVIDGDAGGEAVAAFVVGETELGELRKFLTTVSRDVRDRERRAAIEVCIWMVHADRKVDPEEAHLLREIIGASGLSEDVQDELVQATHEPPSLDGLEERLTHPVLRELLLALSWEIAAIDGDVARAERDFYTGLSKRLGVTAARAAEIQRSIAERIG
jgi:tellurite resistance protein